MHSLALILVSVAVVVGTSGFIVWWYYADLVNLRAAGSKWYERWAGGVLDRDLRKQPRWGALNCGRVPVHGNPETANNCVLRALESKRSFRVRYDFRGFDSTIAIGIVGRSSEEVNLVMYDSRGWSNEGLGPGEKIVASRHLIVAPCPSPVRLSETPTGRLTCCPNSNTNPDHWLY